MGKQGFLVFLKVLCLSYLFEKQLNFDDAKWLFVIIVVNVVSPLIFLLASPIDNDFLDQRWAAYDVVNVDLAVRVVEFAANRQRRHEGYLSLKKRIRISALRLADCSPLAEKAINCSIRL